MKTTFAREGSFYRGNLHTHTTVSDGELTPAEAKELYKSHGYSFLALTDHNRYGVHSELCDEDFLIIPGCERDTFYEGKVHHIVSVGGIDSGFEHGERFTGGKSGGSPQSIIDDINSRGDLAVYAHPFWSHALISDLLGLRGLFGMEIFNYSCQQEWRSGNSEVFYDYMLENGRRLMCFGSDDAHLHVPDALGGYITVKCGALDRKSIIGALISGSFYASSSHDGKSAPEILDFYVDDDNTAHLETSPCRVLYLNVSRSRYFPAHSKPGEPITSHSYKLPQECGLVRAIAVDEMGGVSWSQPIYLK